jgi:hypothetical protein
MFERTSVAIQSPLVTPSSCNRSSKGGKARIPAFHKDSDPASIHSCDALGSLSYSYGGCWPLAFAGCSTDQQNKRRRHPTSSSSHLDENASSKLGFFHRSLRRRLLTRLTCFVGGVNRSSIRQEREEEICIYSPFPSCSFLLSKRKIEPLCLEERVVRNQDATPVTSQSQFLTRRYPRLQIR